jgi:TonB-linked SusC/RagA family outer membrane protein
MNFNLIINKMNLKRIITNIALIAAFLLSFAPLAAQTTAVSGVVMEPDGTTPMIGVNVLQKGSTRGTITDVNGKFNIRVTGSNAVLIFRSVGYTTQEVAVGGRKLLKVVMQESTVALQGVVVTALGITRQEKSLGYAVSKVDNTALTNTVSGNWMNAMTGKVPGLNFDNASTGPVSSMRVTLRGDHSFNYGKNGALFVIDGVPLVSGTTTSGSGSNYANGDAPVDFGNGAADINPEDVESVTVLKGAAATALYGSLAGNGAILITTKAGRKDKGIGVTVNSSYTFEKAGYFPDFQKTYGSGSDLGINEFCFWPLDATEAPDGVAVSRNISRYAFGEKFDASKLRYQYASKDWDNNTYTKLPWTYADDWYTGLFRTGSTWNNSVTVSGGNGKGTSGRFSITDTRNNWILPNTGYQSDAVSLAFDSQLNDRIKLSTRVNYIHKGSDNLPVSGYDESSPMYALVWGYNNNSINEWKKEYFNGRFTAENYNSADGLHGKSLVFPSDETYNPYRTLYEELNKLDKNRVYGNVQLNFTITKDLNLNLRSALDMTDEWRTQQKPFYTVDHVQGFYREQSMRTYEYNSDFLLRYTHNDWFDKRLGFSAAIGGNNMQYKYFRNQVTLDKLDNEGVYNITNVPSGSQPSPYNYRSKKIINSLYAFASLSWVDTYYLDITGRNDWSSALSKDNRSYFYPSVSGSVLLSKLLNFEKNLSWFDFLKLRLSWANVGNDTDPFSLDRYYSATSYPGGYSIPGTVPDPNIKPENIETWETGLQGNMLNNRISFDFTLYHSATTDQIVSVDMDQITGATAYTINAGKIVNKGIELSASVTPVKTRNLNWTLDLNWSKNWNKLVNIQDGWDPAQPFQTDMGTTIGSRVFIYSYLGHEMNQIYGRGYQRAPEGSFYTDENGNKVDCSGMKLVNAQGYPILDTNPTRHIGKVNPDWRGGFTSRLTYKNFALTLVFTGQYGGHCYSVTNFSLSYQGKLKNSLKGRNDGIVVDGVQAVTTDGSTTYSKNTTITPNIETYYNSYVWNRNNVEENTFNTSYLKLKELRFDYHVPNSWCAKTKILQSADLGFFATNLFCLTSFPQYDPDTGMVDGSNIHRGIEAMTYPMTRSYGFNVKLSF